MQVWQIVSLYTVREFREVHDRNTVIGVPGSRVRRRHLHAVIIV